MRMMENELKKKSKLNNLNLTDSVKYKIRNIPQLLIKKSTHKNQNSQTICKMFTTPPTNKCGATCRTLARLHERLRLYWGAGTRERHEKSNWTVGRETTASLRCAHIADCGALSRKFVM